MTAFLNPASLVSRLRVRAQQWRDAAAEEAETYGEGTDDYDGMMGHAAESDRAADALFSQTSLIAEIESRSDSYVEENGILAELLSEAREEIERLKGLVAGIRECPQELAKVEADDPPEGNWFNHRSLLPNALQEHWQDIATAPKDGTEILLYGHGVLRSGGVYAKGRHVGWSQLARDGSTYWATRDPAVDCEPTHWMRLPTPPSALEVSDDRE